MIFTLWKILRQPRRVVVERRAEMSQGEILEALLHAKGNPLWRAVHEILDNEIVEAGNELLETGLKAREVERRRGALAGLTVFKAELLERLREAMVADVEREEISRRGAKGAEE